MPLLRNVAPQLRTIAGLGSLVPIAAGSIAVGVVTQSKRNGVNFFTENWPKLMLTIGGVEINVVGAENLAVCRPAVFIFNHRNNFDVFVTASLVRDNWTAVGKKELERDPIAGTIGKIVDAAFIDREDPLAAVDGLHKVEELARNGLSIIIAPEGTRTDTDTVGAFKKGPFQDRDVGEHSDRPGSHSQCGGHRRSSQCGFATWHRRRRGAAAHLRRGLDPRDSR